MPLNFDDLIPQQGTPTAPAAPSGDGLSFDDLVPQAQPTQSPPAMSGTAPVPTTLETFFNNLPKYPGVLANRLANLSKGAVTGDILPQSANFGVEQQGNIPALLSAASMGISPAPGGLPTLPVLRGPTEAALEASKTARYESPAIKDLQLNSDAGEDIANLLKTDLKAAKLDKFNAGPFYDLADRLKDPRFGDNLTIDDLEAARQDAKVEPTAKSNDKRASEVIRKGIDNYLGNIPQSHVLSGDAAAANDALLKARADTASLKRSEEVTNALGRAANKAPASNSGRNFDNLTRQQLVPILDKKTGVAKVPGFEDYTPEEITALQNVIDPSWLENQARNYKNKFGGGGGHGQAFSFYAPMIAAHEAGFSPTMSALLGGASVAAGRGFGALADKLAYSRVDELGNLLRSRSALANEMGPQRQSISPLWFKAPMLGIGMVDSQY